MRSRRARDMEAEVRQIVSSSDRFTVRVGNEVLGTSRYVGSFENEQDASAYAGADAARSRRFVTYELWTGTAKFPGKFVRALGRGQA